MKKLVVILGIPCLLIGVFYLFIWWGSGVAGGGQNHQIIPDSAKTGEPVIVKIPLSVWGSGGDIKGRYTDVQLFYRLVGESDYKQASSILVPQDAMNEIYEFSIPAYPKETKGEIEFYFQLKLDGAPSQFKGGKHIKIIN